MRRTRSKKDLPKSTLDYVIEGLIPYTDDNLKLVFKPGLFFADLENISKQKHNKESYKQAYYRAIKNGFIEIENGFPKITSSGKKKIPIFKPAALDKKTFLMISFDIPESERYKRDRLRKILKSFEFVQVQKSLRVTKLNYLDLLKAEISYSNLEGFIKIYEAKEIE
jgi:CRISPR/Cas system-associated endoribonuclease Cas2